VIFGGMELSSETRGKSGHCPARTGSWRATAVGEGRMAFQFVHAHLNTAVKEGAR
jgi:hypothetical protein